MTTEISTEARLFADELHTELRAADHEDCFPALSDWRIKVQKAFSDAEQRGANKALEAVAEVCEEAGAVVAAQRIRMLQDGGNA